MLSETDQLFSELDITKQFTDDCLELDATADIPVTAMEKAMRDWLSEQIASGVVVSVSGHEDKADTILRELKRVLKYVRSRKDKDSRTDEGHGRVWVYVGARLKPPSTPSTS